MTRDEKELRLKALDVAASFVAGYSSAEIVVKNAEMFLGFLQGTPTIDVKGWMAVRTESLAQERLRKKRS